MITVDVEARRAQPRGRCGGAGRAARALEPAAAAVHLRRLRQVRRAGLIRIRGCGDVRCRAPARAGGPIRRRPLAPRKRRRPMHLSFKTSPQRVDWATLNATWRLAGDLGGWDGAWMNDHLTDLNPDSPGPSLEAVTVLATLVHHVPGLRVGHGVLSNTFRHPVLLAKAATVLDHATGGRFVLGLGAGWFEGEHEPFGIPLPPIGERIDRLTSAVGVLQALFSPEAAAAPGVTRPDRVLPARRGGQRTSAAHARRAADLPRWPEAARDPAGGGARSRLAAHGHGSGRYPVLHGASRGHPAGARRGGPRSGHVRRSSARSTPVPTRPTACAPGARPSRWRPPGRPR